MTKAVYPMLCHTQDDDELYETDPYEYVRRGHGKERAGDWNESKFSKGHSH